MKKKATIIPVASGKGGVGKSVFTANLAIALAKLGYSIVAIDLDLGGSNLHTYLGMSNKYSGLGDFLKSGHVPFEELSVKTPYENLRFIPGDGRTPFMANIPFKQRLDLLDHIQRIPADYVLCDLGAGSTFNTLNFYGMSHYGIIVTTFEPPAIMNFFMFIKNFIFRVISSMVRHDKVIFNQLVNQFRHTMSTDPLTVTDLIKIIEDRDPDLAKKAFKACSYFKPRIIFNMGDYPDELKLANKIDITIRQNLSIEVEYFGYIFYDDNVRKCARKKTPLMVTYPDSIASLSISDIARRITKIWSRTIDKSALRLLEDTKKKYSVWKK